MLSADFKRKGSFADVVLPGLLVPALNARFTGMFRAERESIIKVIYFKEGEIAFASSNQPSDRLGEVLIKRGQLSREQLDMAMSKLEANVSLGRMLVELGYLSPKELLGGAKTQVEEILFSLNTWHEGHYEFVEGPLPPKIVDLKLNTRQVIFQCTLHVENRGWVLGQIGSMESAFAREPGLDEAVQAMPLEADVQAVIASIDGHNTVRDLCARSRLDEFTVTKIVAALNLLDLLRVAESGSGGPEYLARYGEEPAEAAFDSQSHSTVIGRVPESETVPGFAPSFEPDTDSTAAMSTEPGMAAAEDETVSIGAPRDSASGRFEAAPFEQEPADEEPPADEEEMAYEEEGLGEDEEPSGRRRLLPLILGVGLAALLSAGAIWWLFLRGPGEEEPPIPVAVGSPTVGGTPRATARPTTDAVAGTTGPAGATAGTSATPAAVAASSPKPGPAASPASSTVASPVASPMAMATVASRPSPAASVVAALPPLAGSRPTPAGAAGATPVPAATPVPTAPVKPSPAAGASVRPTLRLVDPTPVPRSSPAVVARATPQPTARATPPRSASSTPQVESTQAASGASTGLAAASARTKLNGGSYADAARDFRSALSGRNGYTLQLEIVCQDSSIKDGLARAAGSDDYFILPFSYRGRSCYRAFWGVYPSRAAAAAAQRDVPEFFRSQVRGRPLPIVALGAAR